MIIQNYPQFFFKDVCKIYGLSTKIVSNKHSIFISTLLKTLGQQLDTQLSTSIIFHAQTNGQNKVVSIIGGRVALHEKQKQCKTWDGSFLYIHHSYNQEHHCWKSRTPHKYANNSLVLGDQSRTNPSSRKVISSHQIGAEFY